MRPILTQTIASSIALASVAAAPRKVEDPKLSDRPNQVTGDEITPAQQKAVAQGLAYLAARQRPDGSFGSSGITALAGIAFMSAGNLPGRGQYGAQVEKCLQFVMQSTQQSGLIANDNTHGPMYGHGFATLFLAEVYGMSSDENVKETLKKAVRLLERTQNPEGGWRYQPVPFDADISVTIAEIMALRAARDAGIKVEKEIIEKAIGYVRKCQNPDGGFNYTTSGGGSGFARSAAGVAALYYAGVFEGNDLKNGLKFLHQFSLGRGGGGGAGMHGGEDTYFFYGNYYACQAMFLAGGDYWTTYYPRVRERLLQRQNKASGSWTGEAGEDYATAMGLIILQMPNRYLPVFHGKGPGH